MHLDHPFYKFPFRLDASRLQQEVNAVPESAWTRHPQAFKGNSALPLISTRGEINDDYAPPMRPTPFLARSPHLQQVLSLFKTVLGRARLMRLEPGCGVPQHFDAQFYWRSHTRVHIPITTHPDIRFHCGDVGIHMAEGEAWTFDNWRSHRVDNPTDVRRIHLVFDTYGSSAFWAMAHPLGTEVNSVDISFDPKGTAPPLFYETHEEKPVVQPGEIELEMSRLAADVERNKDNDPASVSTLSTLLTGFSHNWRCAFSEAGPTPRGGRIFAGLLKDLEDGLKKLPDHLRLASNGARVKQVMDVILHDIGSPLRMLTSDGTPRRETPAAVGEPDTIAFDRPVFIVAAPRSGSTLLFETLAGNSAVWTVGGESHDLIESIPQLSPMTRDFESNRLAGMDLTPEIGAELHARFVAKLRHASGDRPLDGCPLRFLEKTPKNALRIPFFKALYPDARFIYLFREPRANLSAIMEAWRSGRFRTYPELPGFPGPWSLLLTPGWRQLTGEPLQAIAAHQWCVTNSLILDDLAHLPKADWCAIRYEAFLADTETSCRALCDFADIPFDDAMATVTRGPLRHSRYTLTPPNAGKWRKNEREILSVIGPADELYGRMRSVSDLS